MKILVAGSRGQLGWELLRLENSFGFEAIGFDLPQIGITIKSNVENILNNINPAIVL